MTAVASDNMAGDNMSGDNAAGENMRGDSMDSDKVSEGKSTDSDAARAVRFLALKAAVFILVPLLAAAVAVMVMLK